MQGFITTLTLSILYNSSFLRGRLDSLLVEVPVMEGHQKHERQIVAEEVDQDLWEHADELQEFYVHIDIKKSTHYVRRAEDDKDG